VTVVRDLQKNVGLEEERQAPEGIIADPKCQASLHEAIYAPLPKLQSSRYLSIAMSGGGGTTVCLVVDSINRNDIAASCNCTKDNNEPFE